MEEIQVVRRETCLNISQSGNIVYEMGSSGEGEFIRLVKSDKGGMCSRDWISMKDVKKLAGFPNITAKDLRALFGEKSSTNNPYFFKAVLMHERICNISTTVPLSIPAKAKPAKDKKSSQAA